MTSQAVPMRALNRSAVVVVPKQPFLDWLHRVDSSSGKLTLTDLGGDPSVYLLPECDLEPELEDCLKEACVEIFADQLNGWYRAEELWPEDRNLGIFRLWFDYAFIQYWLILRRNHWSWRIFDVSDALQNEARARRVNKWTIRVRPAHRAYFDHSGGLLHYSVSTYCTKSSSSCGLRFADFPCIFRGSNLRNISFRDAARPSCK